MPRSFAARRVNFCPYPLPILREILKYTAITCFPARGKKFRRAGLCFFQKVECRKGVLFEMGKSGRETSFFEIVFLLKD